MIVIRERIFFEKGREEWEWLKTKDGSFLYECSWSKWTEVGSTNSDSYKEKLLRVRTYPAIEYKIRLKK